MQTPPHQSWNLTWDRCVVEPTCDDLPDPDPSSGLRRKGDGAAVDVVKMGHSVVYECINRTLCVRQEVPNEGPEIKLACKGPVTSGKATLERPSQWPTWEAIQ